MTTYPHSQIWLVANDEKSEALDFCGGKLCVFSRTSPDKGTSNEDAAGIVELSSDHGVLVVADGMGGANAGDRAAECVVRTIVDYLISADLGGETSRSQILDAIESANQEVLRWGLGAGSTVVVVEYHRGTLRSFHVGDAMAVACSNRGRIKLSTVAHAPVAMAVESGMIGELEAIVHEDRHLINNCVGSNEMKIELGPILDMASKDTLVMGSDGLFDNLTLNEVVDFVRAGHLEAQFDLLIASVCTQMQSPDMIPSKPDDLTVICFRQ